MSEDQNRNPEEKAIDALVTGTLHVWSSSEPSESEVKEFLTHVVELTDAEKEALTRVSDQLKFGIAQGNFLTLQESCQTPYMAMNRENMEDQIPTEARDELERKRAELMARLKAKKRPTG